MNYILTDSLTYMSDGHKEHQQQVVKIKLVGKTKAAQNFNCPKMTNNPSNL